MDLFEPSGLGRFDSSVFGLRLNIDQAIAEPYDPQLFELTLRSFHAPAGHDHRRYVESIQDPAKRGLALALFTLASHETKHFHDLLITPYGSMLMRQYTRLALLALSCYPDLFLLNKAIVLPLRDWVDDLQLYQSMIPPAGTPHPNTREVADVIQTMMGKLEAFNHGVLQAQPQYAHLTATSILEGLAILVQEQVIVSAFGEHQLPSFRRLFEKDDVRLRYYGALSFVVRCFETAPSADVVSLILLAALCGNFQDQDPERPRYPKDLLIQMMVWLKDNRPKLFSGATEEDVFSCIDDFFDQELGDDLLGMSMQAAKANEGVRSSFDNIAGNYAKYSSEDGLRAARIVELFTNFRDVQAGAASNVMIDPRWYVSGEYGRTPGLLPQPVFYLESERGLPVTDEMERIYYVQSESRIDLASAARDLQTAWSPLATSGAVRVAHRLALRGKIAGATLDERKPSTFMFEMPELDIPLWHSQYDSAYSLLRVLIEGFEGNMLGADRRELEFLFSTVGVQVYSKGALRPRAELPKDWSAQTVDPFIRELMSDERFAAILEEMRNRV